MPQIEFPKIESPRMALLRRYRKPLLLALCAFAVLVFLYFGYHRLSGWLALKDYSKLEKEIYQLERERDQYKGRAEQAAKQVEQKNRELAAANERAEAAERAFQAAQRNRQRAQAAYEQIKNAPIDHTQPAPSVDALCQKLLELGKPCRE